MTRYALLPLVAVFTLAVAGCGAEGCSSNAAPVNAQGLSHGCSTLQAGSSVTINIPLCPLCTDTSASCNGEVREDIKTIELNSTVQQCSAQAGCDTSGCSITPVSCALDRPLTAGVTYTVSYVLPNAQVGSTSVQAASGGSSSCSL